MMYPFYFAVVIYAPIYRDFMDLIKIDQTPLMKI